MAELRVPADVSADRAVRRLDRHGDAAGRLAAAARSEDLAAVRDTVADGLSLMLMLNVPATVGLMVLADADRARDLRARPVHAGDTVATAAALQFYALGLVGYSVVRIASPTFYALGRNRMPVIVSMVDGAGERGAELRARSASLGYRGLALGTSIAALFNAGTLLVLLRAQLCRA